MNIQFRFKHLVSEPLKEVWKNSKVSSQIYEGNMIKVNRKYIAYLPDQVGGVLSIFDMKKHSALADTMPCLRGHEGSIQDLEFMPYSDNILATAGYDSKIKIWKIPDEITEDIKQCECTLSGHTGKCTLLQFNGAASGILASTSYDRCVCVWDIIKGSNILNIQGSQKEISTCIDWNLMGKLLASTWKDKFFRIMDPRQKSITLEVLAHEGNKSSKVSWMGSFEEFLTTVGYSSTHQREIKLWDLKKTNEPLQNVKIDNQSGILFPFYDPDLQIMYLAAKGESSIKYYEFINNQYVNFQNDYRSATQQKSIAIFPKLSLDTSVNEIARFLKITDCDIEQVQFKMPRKAQNFQADLYPDTFHDYAVTNEEWLNGVSKEPKKVQIQPQENQIIQPQSAIIQVAHQQQQQPYQQQNESQETIKEPHQEQVQNQVVKENQKEEKPQQQQQQQQEVIKPQVNEQVPQQQVNHNSNNFNDQQQQAMNGAQEKEIADLQQQMKESQAKWEEQENGYQQQQQQLKKQIEYIQVQNNQLEKQILEEKDKQNEAQKKSEDMKNQLSQTDKNIQEQEKQVAQLKEQIEKLSQENDELKQQNKLFSQQNSSEKLSQENLDLKKRLVGIKKHIVALKELAGLEPEQSDIVPEQQSQHGNIYSTQQFQDIAVQVDDLKLLVTEIEKQ